jgi:predicted CopG family antitoxin
MSADKRIPVSEERWKELGEMKDAGQTYDDLLQEMIENHREHRLAEMVREKRENGDFIDVDVDDW